MYDYDDDFITATKLLSFSTEEKEEIYKYIFKILENPKWEKMKSFSHHLETRAMHSIEVCCVSWRKAKKIKRCDHKSVAIGALLHDFFLYDWQNEKANYEELDVIKNRVLPNTHGFIHPKIALANAICVFPELVNEKITDIILKHMWPLTVTSPKYIESWLVCFMDKSCSIKVFKKPSELPKYFGLSAKGIKLI